jgi:peptidoglycan/LPS O-acetylase OafA/YrhL
MFFYALFGVSLIWKRSIALPGLSLVLLGLYLIGQVFDPVFAPASFWTDPLILEFMVGMLIAEVYRRGVHLPVWISAGIVVLAVLGLWLGRGSMPPTRYRVFSWGLPAAALVASCVLTKRRAPRWLATPINLLGNASYALYLIHPLIGGLVISHWSQGLNTLPTLGVVTGAAVVAQLLSIAIFVLLEKPCTQALLSLGRSPRLAEGKA